MTSTLQEQQVKFEAWLEERSKFCYFNYLSEEERLVLACDILASMSGLPELAVQRMTEAQAIYRDKWRERGKAGNRKEALEEAADLLVYGFFESECEE